MLLLLRKQQDSPGSILKFIQNNFSDQVLWIDFTFLI
jgi:hypothetical protein